MTFNEKSKRAVGTIGTVVILVLLVGVGFIGVSWGLPYVAAQEFTVGDTMDYSVTTVNGTISESHSFRFTVTAKTGTHASFQIQYNNSTVVEHLNCSMLRHGNKLQVQNAFMFMQQSQLSNEHSYSVMMIGYTPTLVESYNVEEGGVSYQYFLKAGTLLMVKMIATEGSVTQTMTMTGASMMWAQLV